MIKYTANSFLASKTAFFNQIFDICEKAGLDYDIVRHIVTQDPRIGSSHTLVPGSDTQRGFGGACFPKDTEALVHWTNTIDQPFTILEEVVRYNKQIRKNA
jgi:UDPglucose 6-dehydrogenase